MKFLLVVFVISYRELLGLEEWRLCLEVERSTASFWIWSRLVLSL
jgi:hypothetical protein